jgi:hypothetical protein
MNEDEAFYEDSKWDEEVLHEAGEFRNGRPYLGRWEPDRYPDEPKKQATQASEMLLPRRQGSGARSSVMQFSSRCPSTT